MIATLLMEMAAHQIVLKNQDTTVQQIQDLQTQLTALKFNVAMESYRQEKIVMMEI
jgi:hypothetical protein